MKLTKLLDELKPTPSSYLSTARKIEAGGFAQLRPLNVAILSTCNLDLLRPYLTVECAAWGLLAKPYFAPFNQLEQQVLETGSSLYESKPEVVVFATRIEEMAPTLASRFMTMSPSDVDHEMRQIEERLRGLAEGLRRNSTATILMLNFLSPRFLSAGLADPSLQISQTSVIQRANDRVADICRTVTNAYVFDYARMVQEFGERLWYDPKLWYLARTPLSAKAQIKTAQQMARYIHAVDSNPCKCLVVDADNTIWGGVLGEEGLGGIQLSEDYPGNVYKDFQRTLLSLKDRGVLLALASKNNEQDVLDALKHHTDCLLKPQDFAAVQIHWEDKAISLAAIAEELNIGKDALAFFDDSPFEREWVRAQLPEVKVIDVPENPMEFASALVESGVFDHLTITSEDRSRSDMYQKEKDRRQLYSQNLSMEDFLRKLEMVAAVGQVNAESLPRVAQLLAKTNQFNLTTRRHTPSDIQTMIDSGAVALWLRVADRFGDNGLVAVAIAVPEESNGWRVDTFLMSCRVFGRRIESVLLSMLSRIIKDRGGEVIVGEYLPTGKNDIASEFYSTHGFDLVEDRADVQRWVKSGVEIESPDFISVRVENGSGTKE